MRKLGPVLISTALVFSAGFLKKSADGSYSVDTAAAEKQATEAAAKANAELDKAAKQASDMQEAATLKIKEAAAKINVPKEEILADLGKSLDDMKAKVGAMDATKLAAYLNQYNNVLKETQAKVTDYTKQVKDLKWTQKMSKKGKELKATLKQYSTQFKGFQQHATLYLDKLKAFGVDPAALGLDLSAYGL